jgi:hypothetical protein
VDQETTMAVGGVKETLARDVFPAEVVLPDGQVITDARVWITNRRLIAIRHTGGDQFPSHTFDLVAQVQPDRGSLMGALAVHTEAGVAYVNRGRGCGCQSPLQNFSAPAGWR